MFMYILLYICRRGLFVVTNLRFDATHLNIKKQAHAGTGHQWPERIRLLYPGPCRKPTILDNSRWCQYELDITVAEHPRGNDPHYVDHSTSDPLRCMRRLIRTTLPKTVQAARCARRFYFEMNVDLAFPKQPLFWRGGGLSRHQSNMKIQLLKKGLSTLVLVRRRKNSERDSQCFAWKKKSKTTR